MDKYQLLGTHISLARARNELVIAKETLKALGIDCVEIELVHEALNRVKQAERCINQRINGVVE